MRMSLLRGWRNKTDIILLGQQGGCVAPTMKRLEMWDFRRFYRDDRHSQECCHWRGIIQINMDSSRALFSPGFLFYCKQESRTLSTSKLLNKHTLRFTPFANVNNILQNESLRHNLSVHTHTHTRAHMSWLWALIWDHDKHAADGAHRERESERET